MGNYNYNYILMGNYINKLPSGEPLDAYGKANAIARLPGVRELLVPPIKLATVPEGFITVAVVVDHPWEAALVCDVQYELNRINHALTDGRETRYFYVPRETVRQMADQKLESEI
jgi:hypothetical protein